MLETARKNHYSILPVNLVTNGSASSVMQHFLMETGMVPRVMPHEHPPPGAHDLFMCGRTMETGPMEEYFYKTMWTGSAPQWAAKATQNGTL